MGDERKKTGRASGGIPTAVAASRAEHVGRHVEPRRVGGVGASHSVRAQNLGTTGATVDKSRGAAANGN